MAKSATWDKQSAQYRVLEKPDRDFMSAGDSQRLGVYIDGQKPNQAYLCL